MANYLLDTNILILVLRSTPKALDFLDDLIRNEDGIFVSVVTRTEIFAGMHSHEEQRTTDLLGLLNSLPLDEPIADQAGRFIYQYARQGIQLSVPDAQIAATALHHNLNLVTTNTKHFPMPDLKLQTIC
ncbi:MAG TPA: type II toxin-antitoxin system VapC family toxin [Anaerolineae bacterium]|nr:type II toxin-antitoxin system VapC family toxin [Anaerolineae bacterium]